MRTCDISTQKCNSEGWKKYSIRVYRNLYLLPHIMSMIKLMDVRRAGNVLPIGEKKEVYMVILGCNSLSLDEWFSAF